MPDTLKEGKRTIKLTEEQVLAWNRANDDYMDKSHGTQIGSSAPFNDELDGKTSNQGEAPAEPIHEAEGPVHNSDTTLYPMVVQAMLLTMATHSKKVKVQRLKQITA